jgi:hypothetical protein
LGKDLLTGAADFFPDSSFHMRHLVQSLISDRQSLI